MTEPLTTIYECPAGHLLDHGRPHAVTDVPDGPVGYSCAAADCINTATPVRMFREEDVKALWIIANVYRREVDYLVHGDGGARRHEPDAIDRFPAPEDWR